MYVGGLSANRSKESFVDILSADSPANLSGLTRGSREHIWGSYGLDVPRNIMIAYVIVSVSTGLAGVVSIVG